MKQNDRRKLVSIRKRITTLNSPGNPTFGMEWVNPLTGELKVYVHPGEWKSTQNITSVEWADIIRKPNEYPPTSHTHSFDNIVDRNLGAWDLSKIPEGETKIALNNLKNLLKLKGLIN